MAVYKMKRNKPAGEPAVEDRAQPKAEQAENASSQNPPSAISRSKNRSLDAYVGSGKKGRRSKENVGSIVDDVYHGRRTAHGDSSNETDRILMEVFGDDKKAKKERKRQEKEEAAARKRAEKERKKREKALAREKEEVVDEFSDSLDAAEDASPFEKLYSPEELVLSMMKNKESQGEKEKAEQEGSSSEGGASVLDSAFLESLIAGGEEQKKSEGENEKKDAAKEESPETAEIDGQGAQGAPVAEGVFAAETAPEEEQKILTEEEAKDASHLPALSAEELLELYGEQPEDNDAERTREFDMSGLDAATVKAILDKEAREQLAEGLGGADGGKGIAAEDLFDDSLEEEEPLTVKKEKTEEFTENELAEEMTEGIKDKSAQMLACAVWSFLVMLVSLYLASFAFTALPRPAFLMPGKYGIILLLADFQLLVISGVLIRRHLLEGFQTLFTGKAGPDSVTAAAMSTVAVYQISLLFTSATSEKLMLFTAVGCFFAFLNCVHHFLEERRNYRSFRVVSSKKDKLVARKLGTDSGEYEALKEHLPEDPDIFTIEKTKFVSNYFARSRQRGQISSAYNVAVWMVFAVALVFGIYNFSGGFAQAIKSFTLVTLFGLPACSLFTVALPLGKLSKRCAANDSAVIGMPAVEEYCSASVLSFNDTELFPAEKIRVTSIRTYGNHRIDKSILYAAMIFKKVGGPLSRVFSDALSGAYAVLDQSFEILENTGDGICAKIEGREVFVGNKDYMLSYDFGYVNDDIDEPFENSVGRIMYMAVGDRIAAKFYIRYAVNAKFERVMRALYKTGICISIKTCDPNLDNELIKCIMKNRDYPVCILKTAGASLEQAPSERSDSGIVCTSSILNMLRAFIRCEKTKRLISVNLLVKFISLLVGLFVSVLLCFMGRMDSITTLFVIVYQLLWLLAVLIPSATD